MKPSTIVGGFPKYFDDMNNDVQITGKRHYSKSLEGFNRLPEVFTLEDVRK